MENALNCRCFTAITSLAGQLRDIAEQQQEQRLHASQLQRAGASAGKTSASGSGSSTRSRGTKLGSVTTVVDERGGAAGGGGGNTTSTAHTGGMPGRQEVVARQVRVAQRGDGRVSAFPSDVSVVQTGGSSGSGISSSDASSGPHGTQASALPGAREREGGSGTGREGMEGRGAGRSHQQGGGEGGEAAGGFVDVAPLMHSMALDVLGTAVFGCGFASLYGGRLMAAVHVMLQQFNITGR